MKKRRSTFPQSNLSILEIWRKLGPVARTISKKKVALDLGSLDTPSLMVSKIVTMLFSIWNINHLGNWSGKSRHGWATQQLERELFAKLAAYFHSDLDRLGGYVTGGATEGNLFLAWMGKQKLRSNGDHEIVLLKTSLTHYSLTKIAEIIDVKPVTVPLSPETWSMSQEGLEETLLQQLELGVTHFLIPLTLGYSATGTSDDYQHICSLLKKLQRKHSFQYFCWIDAALNGVFMPVIDSQFAPFRAAEIQGLVFDFHKFGLVPPNAGAVLYLQSNASYIQKNIEYLDNIDLTLTGGRSGVPAVAAWTAFHYLGLEKLRNRAQKCFETKKYFLSLLESHEIKYVTHPQSLTVGILRHQNQRLTQSLESDYSLHFSELKLLFDHKKSQQKISLYKLFILPHVTKPVIEKFVSDLAAVH